MNKAVILVGGPSRATRFRPLSMNMPQPLFPVGGKPIVWHQVKALSKTANLKEIILLGFFEEHVFKNFLDQCTEEFPHISFRYLREYSVLGTAGGLFHFRDLILHGNTQNVFLLYTDICSSFPLEELLQKHIESKKLGTIMATKVCYPPPSYNTYFYTIFVPRSSASKYGCVVADKDSDLALHYVEKPQTYVSDLASTGVYVFSSKIFNYMAEIIEERDKARESISSKGFDSSFGANSETLRLEQDVLQKMTEDRELSIYQTKGFWRQIKSAASAVPANAAYLIQAQKDNESFISQPTKPASIQNERDRSGPIIVGAVYIHPSAIVDNSAKIGPNVSIHAHVVIGAGARIKNSIVLDHTVIKDNSAILNAIIGWRGKIGRWSRVEGNPIDEASNDVEHVTSSGIKINSICILGQETTVNDEIFVRSSIVLPYKEISSDQHNEIIM
ncbi:putative mannose-1-phosphate guanyltransferase [Smittium culicis]|uniref:mannose-1-phosphate guanylyltransferase n=1 Tax=Smittium culicis TaxID=133412 RepID=A0A1R1Y8S7_9FUNG|nr:putative mannose-1-phosphate guanyltransferase [Smittium culicis]OMJ23361.1 putative mannose-1-phosphate guanyltransferase [Smittium culicis]